MTTRRRILRRIKGLLSYDLFLAVSLPLAVIWGAWQYSVTVDNKIWAFHPPIVEGPLPKGPLSEYRRAKPSVAMNLAAPVSLLQALATSSAVYLQYVVNEAMDLKPVIADWRWEAAGLYDRITRESMVI